eukprot:scaffold77481_cov64-Phaeocystis_antarctica.AAC.8
MHLEHPAGALALYGQHAGSTPGVECVLRFQLATNAPVVAFVALHALHALHPLLLRLLVGIAALAHGVRLTDLHFQASRQPRLDPCVRHRSPGQRLKTPVLVAFLD